MAQESCAIILPQFIAVCVIALSGTLFDFGIFHLIRIHYSKATCAYSK